VRYEGEGTGENREVRYSQKNQTDGGRVRVRVCEVEGEMKGTRSGGNGKGRRRGRVTVTVRERATYVKQLPIMYR